MKQLDIAPYTREEATALGIVLARAHIPSCGPGIGMKLLEMAEAVRTYAAQPEVCADCRALLVGYAARLIDVAGVAAGQSGEIIEMLRKLLEQDRN